MTAERLAYQNFGCLGDAFRRAVPKDATVYVANGSVSPGRAYLLEVAALWATPVASRRTAAWEASLQPGKECSGYSLKVTKLR
jgi:hypothetical protein